MGTFKYRTTTERAPRSAHASRPPSRAAFPPASTSRPLSLLSDSTSRLHCAKPTAPAHLDENDHDGPHVPAATTSWLSPQTQNQLSAAQVGRVGSRDLALLFGLCLASAGRANRHGDVAGRSRRKLYRRDRQFALVVDQIGAASSEAGAWRNSGNMCVAFGLFRAAMAQKTNKTFEVK